MRRSSFFLYLAILVFAGSAIALMASLLGGSRILATGGVLGTAISGVFFFLAVWNSRHKVDWERIEAEQRLWESGPMGRKWLRARRRIYRRWQL